jgi:Ni/Co efflux regulator RcnB
VFDIEEEEQLMQKRIELSLSFALVLACGGAFAEPPHGGEDHGGGHEERGEMHAEPHPGPRGYQRVGEPQGWNNRPATVDRGAYQHNFQAARVYHVGAYRRPPGWHEHHWVYGEVLPRAYWGPQYLLADYWLFALEVPPVGYEWVREGSDALLVNVTTGEILQVEYGVFG